MTEEKWLVCDRPDQMLSALTGGAEWFEENEPMQFGTPAKVSPRKLRLWCCAACRLVWDRLGEASRRAVEVGELYADGLVGEGDRQRAMDALPRPGQPGFIGDAQLALNCIFSPFFQQWRPLIELLGYKIPNNYPLLSCVRQADLVREIVGNPYRQVQVTKLVDEEVDSWAEADWLTPTVLTLAKTAYEERTVRRCESCRGTGGLFGPPTKMNDGITRLYGGRCKGCPQKDEEHGTGLIDDGTLDQVRLAVLADALEEAGCPVEEEAPCPICTPYQNQPCPHCEGVGVLHPRVFCPTCDRSKKFPVGYHPERDSASGRHEGGWTNCKRCNSGGKGYLRAGRVNAPNPLLASLRSPGPHFRGLHTLDILLGKE